MTDDALALYVESAELLSAEQIITASAETSLASMAEIVRQARLVRDGKLWEGRAILQGDAYVSVYDGWLAWLEELASNIKTQKGVVGFSASQIRSKLRLADALEPLGYTMEQIIAAPYQYLLEQTVALYGGPPRLKISTGDAQRDLDEALEVVDAVVTGSDHNPRQLLEQHLRPNGTVTFYETPGAHQVSLVSSGGPELWAVIEDADGFQKKFITELDGVLGDELRRKLKPSDAANSSFFVTP